MQVTQAPLPRSLNLGTRKGKSRRVNASELPRKASSRRNEGNEAEPL